LLLTAILIAILAGLLSLEYLGPQFGFSAPLIAGTIIGLILGDVRTALPIAATIQMAFMGIVAIGGAIPPDTLMAGVVGVSVAILTKTGVEGAMAIALPAALFAQQTEILLNTVCISLAHRADKYAAEGNLRGVERMHLLGLPLYFLERAIPTFLVVYFGVGPVKAVLAALPDWLTKGLSIAGGLLPAVGFALLLNVILSHKNLGYFMVGFAIMAYLKLPILGAAIIGLGLVLILDQLRAALQGSQASAEVQPASEAVGATQGGKVTRKDLIAVFWRQMLLQGSINFERLQGLGYAYTFAPVLKRLYPDKEAMAVALTRHMQFFNTTPPLAAPILGVNAALEEQSGNEADEAVRGIKAGMMGPLAGIGDSILWFTVLPIALGIGSMLAKEGSIVGPVLALIIINAVIIPLRYYGLFVGYRRGLNLVMDVSRGALARVTDGAMALGAFVAGALISSLVVIKTPLAFGDFKIQGALDGILPGLLPLAATLICLALVKKRVKTVVLVIAALIVAIALGAVGVLG